MPSHRIETRIEIDAPPQRVWSILTDFAGMASWNPFITSISGELKPGSRLAVRISPPGKRTLTFNPTIVTVRPQRELRWLGHFLMPGIFDGEHSLLLTPTDHGIRFTHSERFSGMLAGLMRNTLAATEAGFNAMNSALKQRAEQQDGANDPRI